MPRTRPPYAPKFRQQMVEPVRAERDELGRLKRENRRLRQEREILAKAAAWFARQTGSIPSGSSSS